jgi:cytochrome c556
LTAPAAGGTGSSGASARESLADGERHVAVRTDAQGRKWLGDVPYDVFFDDPLAVAAEGRTDGRAKGAPSTAQPSGKAAVASAEPAVGSSATPGPTTAGETSTHPANRAGTNSTTSAGTSTGKAAAASTDWSELIDPDTLDAEVKRIRTELTAGLQSVGKYNARYQEIAVAGSTLAALAEIVVELPRSSSWKEHAANVRDLAASIHDAAKALGGPAYQATKTPTDQLMDVLDGNLPAGLPGAEPMRDFSQVANRSALMKRMDRSFQRLKKGGTAQQLLKNNAPQALEDAATLAVLSRVISVGHYDSADDPKYHAHATDLTRGATDLATAAKSGEAPAFADALTRIQKRCDACHADFRF